MEWKELTVTASTQAEEAVAELFYQAGCSGVVIEDSNLLREYIGSGSWDYHDFELPEVSDVVLIKGYFPADEFLEQRKDKFEQGLRELVDIFPKVFVRLKQDSVKEEDWANAWKTYFKPVKVGERIVVKPTWEQYKNKPGELVMELDPGMAFGTGTHPTTSLCIRALEKLVTEDMLVYDIGTGSGILAIASALLGAKVKAVDLDPVAVRVAGENVALNGLGDMIDLYHGNLAEVLSEQADLVVANIIAEVIIILAGDLRRILKPGGICIASGIIEKYRADVEKAFTANGFSIEHVDEENGWVLIQARRE